QQDSGLIVPVFQKGDDPIDAINHMMSSNHRQQATIIIEELHYNQFRGDKLLLLWVLQGLTLQEQVEAILENRGRLFATTPKGKATCPDSAPNQREKGMIRDPDISDGQGTQTVITHNDAAY
ncbi:hypothetical protein Tco_0258271, partial [Tanacetum coccineum]